MIKLRKLLYPLSILYGWITSVRNILYDKNVLASKSYDLPVICVGNLSVGGTGKSPMIEYLANFLKNDFKVGVLSRGYKRESIGYKEVSIDSKVAEVGDEPLQIKQNYPDIQVAVCADRRTGIEELKKKVGIILLDDAFQHRKVKASTYILLTSFNNLYTEDMILPAGNLRESAKGIQRADIVVVTKCPEGVAYAKLQEIEFNLKLDPSQKLYFSKISYDTHIYGATEKLPLSYLTNKSFLLVTGIANPKPLVEFLKRQEFTFEHKEFPDHHNFSDSEVGRLKKHDIILTTEKDYTRLQPKLKKYALYYLPIKMTILKDQEEFFQQSVLQEIDNYRSKIS